jgi:hypothetical protein
MSKFSIQKKAPKGKMYECQAFFPSGFPKKWKYVTDLGAFAAFLSRDHAAWKYFNVYEKGSKLYLKRFYPGNHVPKVLGLLLAVLLTQKFTSNKTTLSLTQGSYSSYKNTFNKTTSTNGIYYTATIPTPLGIKKEVLCVPM